MLSATVRKSLTDLSRRRARTAFTAATLAFAVASLSLLSISTLIDDTMQDEVRASRLADVVLSMPPVTLSADQVESLTDVPNVREVQPRSSVDVRVLVGERRAPGRVIGVADIAHQRVDVVDFEPGALPGPGELAVEAQDANVGVYDGSAGDTVTVLSSGVTGAAGSRDFVVSGGARSLPDGEAVQDGSLIVLYATPATVAELSGEAGYDQLSILLEDNSPAAVDATVTALRRELAGVPGFTGFRDLPQVRAPGEWPGKADTENFSKLLSVITVLAMLSALVLVSTTMSTLVAEQTREIGVMRAVGARRRQIATVYLTTALLLGAIGAVAGVVLGTVLANVAADYFGSTFWAVDVAPGIDPGVLVLSLLVGLLAPPLAVLPAIRRAARTDLREALESTGSVTVASGTIERTLRRVTVLPRTAQIGLRSIALRKRRSLATVLIIAMAVGNLLAIMALQSAVTETTTTEWGDHLEDVRIWTGSGRPFDQRAEQVIRETPGVDLAQPALTNEVRLDGNEAYVWGVPQDPLLRYRLSQGRWFSKDEEQAREPVAVIERNVAQAAGVRVGQQVDLATAAGPVRLRIVGMADNQQEDGTVLFVPLTTMRELLDQPTGAGSYWIRTTSSDHATVDRTTTLLEDRLAAIGFDIGNEITYVATRDQVAANRTVTTSIAVLGFLVVAISMVGLASAITTTVLERTREIGVLRCLGARARDVRRIFASEGIVLALLGWLVGIPLGALLTRMLVWLLKEIVNIEVPMRFPLANVPLALAGTIVIALLVLALPVRRAVRFRPDEALRHA
jgi:putative ABC transport system permease protein